jgi:fibro-slime domain-containing protein
MSQTRCIQTRGFSLSLFTLGACLLPAGLTDSARASEADPPPQSILLTGVVRDFKERTVEGGHPDFEAIPANGTGHCAGNVAEELDPDGKPVWTGGGHIVNSQWRDSDARPICYRMFSAPAGDTPGVWGDASDAGIQSAASFAQWYRDVPGVNTSMPLTLEFVRDADGSYVFDDKLDPLYSSSGGFFPIDDQLFGLSGGTPSHNYHFTYELHCEFTYHAGGEQVFKFIGDDDVFVFIDGKMVIDIGGIHSAVEQTVDLDRLGLQDGESYRLDFFFAERHRTQSNFRIQTNLLLSASAVPTINASFD